MATATATMPKQHTPTQRALAVEMYKSGATSQDVEKRTGIKASYVRTLAKRFPAKEEAQEADLVAIESQPVSTETVFQETAETVIETPFQAEQKQPSVLAKICAVRWPRFFGAALLFLIVVGHAALIAYDCATLWETPGKIAGSLAFMLILAAMVLMGEKLPNQVSENLLWFVWLLDGVAIFVHYPTFWHNATIGYQFGIREFETWCMSGVVCVISGAAVYFYRQIVIK